MHIVYIICAEHFGRPKKGEAKWTCLVLSHDAMTSFTHTPEQRRINCVGSFERFMGYDSMQDVVPGICHINRLLLGLQPTTFLLLFTCPSNLFSRHQSPSHVCIHRRLRLRANHAASIILLPPEFHFKHARPHIWIMAFQGSTRGRAVLNLIYIHKVL